MHHTGRRVFGVIAANASDIEQREILSGIIEKAQAEQIEIAVISNIYNPIETAEVLSAENGIYDLISSEEFDGFILISESILNADVQRRILDNLAKRPDVPVIVVGAEQKGFSLPHFYFINTSDARDIEDITDHLIDIHGLSDIHILTGQRELQVSRDRVEGYRKALEKHGIPFREENVFYGDFWLNSGHSHAKRYLSGELRFPQALICGNDYMAYGFLDECMEQNVDIAEKCAVVGYEYVRERRFHAPLLATFQRNRKALGEHAVRLLLEKLDSGFYGIFQAPRGTMIAGDTCGCGADRQNTRDELSDMQTKATYDFLNLFSQLEHRLTECRSIDEFVARCWDFQFMIRNVSRLTLCLYEDWYDAAPVSENMTAYNLLTYEEPVLFRKRELSTLFRGDAAPYYFCPLFFAQKELGYAVLRFEKPDTFDPIFRNWLKSIASGLEFLRMKNDIRYLTECQNLTEYRDSLTGMFNEKGLKNASRSIAAQDLYLVALRIGLLSKDKNTARAGDRVTAVLDAAEAVRQFCRQNDLCGRIADDTFVCMVHSTQDAAFLESHLTALLSQHSSYVKMLGMDSFLCSAVPCENESYAKCRDAALARIGEKLRVLSERRLNPHYRELCSIRTMLYTQPEETFDQETVYGLYHGSKGYFRQLYRGCYGITLHDDCTDARISRARSLLAVTALSIAEIAQQCGYADAKYFMRQFQQCTGLTAMQYRNLVN